jgi:hypothetical protein
MTIRWTPEMDALIGAMLDWEVADELGVSRCAVQMRRTALGISSFWKVDWTPEMDLLLGTMPDRDVAAILGDHPGNHAVRKRRALLGIPSWKEQNRVLPRGMSCYSLEGRRIYDARRKHLEARVLNSLTFKQWLFACEWFDNKCAYCGQKAFLTEDHLVPLSKGGPRIVLNIIPACISCNCQKHSKRAHIWIYEKFGREKGREIIDNIVAYLTEVRRLWG